jgi:hypothetical protein
MLALLTPVYKNINLRSYQVLRKDKSVMQTRNIQDSDKERGVEYY